MPRNVRNFWLDLHVDGKKHPVRTGSVTADGGFDLEILIRREGSISDESVRIRGYVCPNGNLTVDAEVSSPPHEITLLRGRR